MAHHRTLLHLDLVVVVGLCTDSELIKYFLPSLRPRVPLSSQSGPWPTPSSVKNKHRSCLLDTKMDELISGLLFSGPQSVAWVCSLRKLHRPGTLGTNLCGFYL